MAPSRTGVAVVTATTLTRVVVAVVAMAMVVVGIVVGDPDHRSRILHRVAAVQAVDMPAPGRGASSVPVIGTSDRAQASWLGSSSTAPMGAPVGATSWIGQFDQQVRWRAVEKAGVVTGGSAAPHEVRAAATADAAVAATTAAADEAVRRARARVLHAQEALTELGYAPGPIDGDFGPRTRAAVRAFQRANQLPVDGLYGRATRSTLHGPDPVAVTPTPEPGAPPDVSGEVDVDDVAASVPTAPQPAACDHTCLGQQAVAALSLPLPSGWSIDIQPAHDSYLAYADGTVGSGTVTLYVRMDRSASAMAADLAHEVGHAWDASGSVDRAAWSEARGLSLGWFDGFDGSDYGMPAGDFAEAVAYCSHNSSFQSRLGPAPSASQCQLALSWIG